MGRGKVRGGSAGEAARTRARAGVNDVHKPCLLQALAGPALIPAGIGYAGPRRCKRGRIGAKGARGCAATRARRRGRVSRQTPAPQTSPPIRNDCRCTCARIAAGGPGQASGRRSGAAAQRRRRACAAGRAAVDVRGRASCSGVQKLPHGTRLSYQMPPLALDCHASSCRACVRVGARCGGWRSGALSKPPLPWQPGWRRRRAL